MALCVSAVTASQSSLRLLKSVASVEFCGSTRICNLNFAANPGRISQVRASCFLEQFESPRANLTCTMSSILPQATQSIALHNLFPVFYSKSTIFTSFELRHFPTEIELQIVYQLTDAALVVCSMFFATV